MREEEGLYSNSRERLSDFMLRGVGTYSGEGSYYSVGIYLKGNTMSYVSRRDKLEHYITRTCCIPVNEKGTGEGILISPGVMFEGIHMDKCSL